MPKLLQAYPTCETEVHEKRILVMILCVYQIIWKIITYKVDHIITDEPFILEK